MQVCGAPLFDDFRENSPGSLARLQQMLDHSEGTPRLVAGGSTVQEATQPAGASLNARPESSSQESTIATTTGLYARKDNGIARDQQPESLRHRRNTNTTLSTSVTNSTWVMPIYHSDRYVKKVEHLAVDQELSDSAFFVMFKKRYHENKSVMQRLLAMRGVKKISCVKVCVRFPLST